MAGREPLDSLMDMYISFFLEQMILDQSLEGLMLKLKLQYFGHLMRRADSLEKTLMLERLKAGEEEDNRG